MLTVLQNDESVFELKNTVIEFTFFPSGEYKGRFNIAFKDFNGNKSSLKNCYFSINYFDHNDKLKEYPSFNFTYRSADIEQIEDNLGSGLEVLFSRTKPDKDKFDFQILFRFYDDTDFFLIKLINIRDLRPKHYKIHSISPFTIKEDKLWLSGNEKPTNLKNITWFKNGWQSWSPCRIFFGKQKDRKGPPLKIFKRTLDNQDYEIEGRFYSEYNTTITDLNSKKTLIIGFTTLKDQFSRIIIDYKKAYKLKLLTAFGCLDGRTFQDSSIDSSEELFIGFKANNQGYYGLIDYAKIVKDNIEEEHTNDVPIGWASWYYYFTEVTEKDIIKNLNFFKKNEETVPIDFIQLDDGYFEKIGDYHDINNKFPHGLSWLFEKIKNAGFKGGIWTAPFFAEKNSNLFQEHPQWFLKKAKKKRFLKTHFNWGTFQYSLDLTQPEILNYIKNYFKKFRYALKDKQSEKESLIEFFKIDFLHAAAPYDADYENKKHTRAQLYYNGVKAIREGISDGSFLLGCGAPLGPCVGLVNAMRIGTDTAPEWTKWDWIGNKLGFALPSLKRALINTLYRSFMHNYFWINDPDCLMIRRTDTDLSLNEIRLQLTLFGISGGQILISDDMTKLNEEEIQDAKLMLPVNNPEYFDPIVPDAFISELPTIYFIETQESIGKRYLVAIINWDKKPNNRTIKISEILPNLPNDEKNFFIFDFWNDKFLGEYNRDATIHLNNIPPHGCSYLSLIFIDEFLKKGPIFLSSDLHISQGCYELTTFEYDEEEMIISVIIDLIGEREGKILIKMPSDMRIKECQYNCSIFDKEHNIFKIEVAFFDHTSFTISLANK
jgi:alpha-galactosidase